MNSGERETKLRELAVRLREYADSPLPTGKGIEGALAGARANCRVAASEIEEYLLSRTPAPSPAPQPSEFCGICGMREKYHDPQIVSHAFRPEMQHAAAPAEADKRGQLLSEEPFSELIAEMKSYADRHNLMEEDFLYVVGLLRRAALLNAALAVPQAERDASKAR